MVVIKERTHKKENNENNTKSTGQILKQFYRKMYLSGFCKSKLKGGTFDLES